eukprot:COSAG06_NODE_38101_length_427_cov_1.015244_1_plen_91_part_10
MQDATCRCGFGGVRRQCLACLLNEWRRVRAAAAARSIEFVVTDTGRIEHTHTLKIADPKHGATPRWYVESAMIGSRLNNLFVVKDRGSGER